MLEQPLAARMRPIRIQNFIGQQHLLGPGKPLYSAIQNHRVHSMILWGPPGTGKTTLAQLLANNAKAHFEKMSAIFAGVKEIRAAMERAQQAKIIGQDTVLFIDEIHRFNKAQQDAFLPYVEEGIITLIGATTENPSFELNNALLSRARVYILKKLTDLELLNIIDLALTDDEQGLGLTKLDFPEVLREQLVQAADGDARSCLNLLEIIDQLAIEEEGKRLITETVLKDALGQTLRRFDKQGEIFYDLISALHKSVRGSAPDAALYWLARMLDGGCDPLYIARRVVRMATEDIGNADPRALSIALAAWDVQERLGSPEGELAIAQAVVYMACAAKSNAVYSAFKAAKADAQHFGTLEVPMHLRNAPTKLMHRLGYGKNYRYAHDEPEAYAAGEQYFPEELSYKQYYHPVKRGLEIKIAEKLAYLKQKDEEVHKKNK
ncbi:MAG: ATPase [Gammaproteobacteria bacterium]|jgi:putative ATPase|nr:ATPase [Gammaproteobacteria bacterium]